MIMLAHPNDKLAADLILGYFGVLSRLRVLGLWKMVLYFGFLVFFQVDFFTEFFALRALDLEESLSARAKAK